MLEADRDLYLDFAQAMNLDFAWTVKLIDGLVQASPLLAETLGFLTIASPEIWKRPEMGSVRLVAVKCWQQRAEHINRLAEVERQALPPRRCRDCDDDLPF